MLTHDSSLPLMVHCIHGKDRTGLFVMLVALLCGLEEEVRGWGCGMLGSLCGSMPCCCRWGRAHAKHVVGMPRVGNVLVNNTTTQRW